MAKKCLWLCIAALLWTLSGGVASAERVLIGVSDKVAMNSALPAVGGRLLKAYDKINVAVAEIPEGQLANLRGKHGVRFVESDHPTRKLGGSQVVTWSVEKIGAPAAWAISQGRKVRVAVLDTGIDAASFDLQVRGGYTAAGIEGDYLVDLDGHGTHSAGIIAALDNNVAMVGVAPKVELYSVKVLSDTGSGSVSSLIDGIMWAMQNNMHVVNMSLGTAKESIALREACQAAYDQGLVLVAAAGNKGTRNGKQDKIEFPAAYPTVVAVGAVDKTDTRATFSATGPALDLVAPGVDIVSLLPGDLKGTGSGTSMAAAHVSGAVALVWAAYPTWTNAQVLERLYATASRVGNGDPALYGRGRVNVASAVGTSSTPAQPGASVVVTVDVAPQTARIGDVVLIKVRAHDSQTFAPIPGATVTLTVYTPAGGSFTTPGYTDEAGVAQYKLRTRKKDGVGAYRLRAQVSKAGYADGVISLAPAFTVQ